MNEAKLHRRELNRLALAALGGLFAGCNRAKTVEKGKVEPANLLSDPHVCRGINTCKGKGKKGTENDCAGQGHCATAKAHDCKEDNECKGQGGCGDHPGENACKGQGDCSVPLKEKMWDKARKRFEELMKKDDKKFGPAPAS